jgi:hypothetical protein
MKTLQRVKNIMRSKKPGTLIAVGGDLLQELQKHLNVLDERIVTAEQGQAVALINVQEWTNIFKQIQSKKLSFQDNDKQLQSLLRLEEIARASTKDAIKQYKSYEGKTDELEEIRKRILQAISMIEVENNVRSITAMYDGKNGFETQAVSLEIETREIRRLLYATDGLMEITS